MTGFYTFKWDRPAKEVYVTGTFDGWSRSTKLDKAGSVFVKKVELPVENILYKFVVDGNWITDPNAPIETEPSGVQNNILTASRIEEEKIKQRMSQATINSAAPQSTTAALAGAVPKESDRPQHGGLDGTVISSAAPDSSTAALAGRVPLEQSAPGSEAIPGGFPETPAVEKTDPTPASGAEEQVFSVNPVPAESKDEHVFSANPLPASDTAENPITLQPGEPVPGNIGTQSIRSNVKLDKESYERGATNFPIGSFILPEVVTPAEQRAAEGRGVLDLAPLTGNMIPESSLPITSAAEAAKKAEAPESQEKTDAPIDVSGAPESVEKKSEVESESKSEVAEKPATAEGSTITSQTVLAAEQVTEKAKPVTAAVATGFSSVIASFAAATGLATAEKPVTPVPEVVKDSISQAGGPAGATAVNSTVEGKTEFEAELKQEVAETSPVTENSTDQVTNATPIAEENAAKIATQTAPVVTDGVSTKTTTAKDITLNKPTVSLVVPELVKESLAEAGVAPEVASEAAVVGRKEVVEEQLKNEVERTEPIHATNGTKPVESTSDPAANAAATVAAPAPVENGTSEDAVQKKSSEGGATIDSKKNKRKSFFGRLKERLHLDKKSGSS